MSNAPRVSLRNVRTATEATIQNERVTRARVEALESVVGNQFTVIEDIMRDLWRLEQQQCVFAIASPWARVKWVLFGVIPPMLDIPHVTKSEDA